MSEYERPNLAYEKEDLLIWLLLTSLRFGFVSNAADYLDNGRYVGIFLMSSPLKRPDP